MKKSKRSKLKTYGFFWLFILLILIVPPVIGAIINKEARSIGYFVSSMLHFLIALLCFLSFAKTKNILFILIGLYLFVGSIHTYLQSFGKGDEYWEYILLSQLIILLISLYFFKKNKQILHSSIHCFLELAANSDNDLTDGYSGRPYPVGKVFYTKEEIIRFGKFVNKSLIAVSYFENNRIVLVFTNNIFYNKKCIILLCISRPHHFLFHIYLKKSA